LREIVGQLEGLCRVLNNLGWQRRGGSNESKPSPLSQLRVLIDEAPLCFPMLDPHVKTPPFLPYRALV